MQHLIDVYKRQTEIVEMLTQTLERKLNEAIYISLSDHIYMAITRYLDGVVVKNSMLWDIKRFYEKEYQAAKKVWKMINQTFKVELPEDEIGFITLHIVNAEMDNENLKQTMEVTKLMQEISNIVRYYFSVEFNTESVYYYRFITHLKFFAQRLLTDKEYEDDQDNELFNTIRQKYRTSYKCVEKIAEFISRKYEQELSDEEKLYLTIHIAVSYTHLDVYKRQVIKLKSPADITPVLATRTARPVIPPNVK